MQHFSYGFDEYDPLVEQRIGYQLPASNDFEERLDFAVRAEGVRQVVEIRLSRSTAAFRVFEGIEIPAGMS